MSLLPVMMTVILVLLDQGTKWQALRTLKPMGNMTVLPGVLDFTFVENRGVAFGMFAGKRWLILLLTVVIAAGLVYYYRKLPRTRAYQWVRAALVLILSGAIGNIIDRVFRGYVVDFFEVTFIQWPVFNVADIYVVVGVALLIFLILFVIKEEPAQKQQKDE